MASFASWMLPHKRRWKRIIAGYQDLPNDSGNWTSGKVGVGDNIGTNRSIAAPTLIAWRNGAVTKKEMMDLSIIEAMEIYKVKFWNDIQGDSINSQAIADILADMKSSAGGNGIKEMQKVLNALGENLGIDGQFGTTSLNALNRQIAKVGEAKIFNAFRAGMIAFYVRINNPYEKQLIGSLERDYPPMKEQSFVAKNAFPIVVSVIALVIILYFYFNRKNNSK